jgi:hypothetical protein
MLIQENYFKNILVHGKMLWVICLEGSNDE